MNIKAQVSMVFHLDKCIGCHTCSIACKNVWTDRPGADYMWWNNVETKPGTGFPIQWENQAKYKGGWELKNGKLRLRSQTKSNSIFNLFYNPNQPGLDDYYEPWTYDYQNLFNAPLGDDQPIARAISTITGEPIEINKGPNWDDDLSGSPIYAKNDPNFAGLSDEEKEHLLEVENIAMMYLPRICNHCSNPSCVASCPSGALYKRGEDGIVLVNQEKCRGWRACVTACPYKKMYYNWKTGKSEKCILCYPRLEAGQAPACFHSCVGRIRYLGVILYDADQIESAMSVPDSSLVEAQRRIILNPNDPKIIAKAKACGISDEMIESAQKSPVYKYVIEWGIAFPLHIEYRTSPMLFYVPALLPIMGKIENGIYHHSIKSMFSSLEKSRFSIDYLSKLFTAGNQELMTAALKKLIAVRYYKRLQAVKDVPESFVNSLLVEGNTNAKEVEAIYRMTTLTDFTERFVLPPIQKEEALEALTGEMDLCKGCGGFEPETLDRKI